MEDHVKVSSYGTLYVPNAIDLLFSREELEEIVDEVIQEYKEDS